MAQIDEYLTEVLQRRGSDLHFLAGDPPRIRLYGDLYAAEAGAARRRLRARGAVRDHAAEGACSGSRSTTARTSPTTLGEARPLPRQRDAPAQRHGRGVPRHSVEGADDGRTEAAGGDPHAGARAQRADPRHRQDRLGQVDHARRDDRRHQPAREGPHPHDRGPHRVRAPAPQLPDQPARDRRAQRRASPRRCTRPCARIRT